MRISVPRGKLNGGLLAALGLHAIACCISLTYVTKYYYYLDIFSFKQAALATAALLVLAPVALSVVFAYRRFTFGYFAGFYLYTVVLGYLWLLPFSDLPYDHVTRGTYALVSLVGFLIPVLLIEWPAKPQLNLSPRILDWVLAAIVTASIVTLAVGFYYNFRLVDIGDIYRFRDQLDFPIPLRYAIGITLGALLPFAFACFVEMKARISACAILLLILCFYPITLTKTTFFAPFWLAFLWLLTSRTEARVTVILSLLGPILLGALVAMMFAMNAIPYSRFLDYFGSVNFRMIAFPSISLDVYNDYFSRHEPTNFCQISLVRSLIGCTYTEQLPIILARAYRVGNMNASMLATEGIASVNIAWTPLVALFSGLVLSAGNYASTSLPTRFVILSSGILIQSLLNVPLSILLVTNGAAMTFFLWFITPCSWLSMDRKERER